MTLAIIFNFMIVLLITYVRFRDVINEAREARAVIKADKLLEAKAEKIKNYVNRRGTRGMTHHTDGSWERTRAPKRKLRIGSNPPPTFKKPNPPPNPPPPTTTRVLK